MPYVIYLDLHFLIKEIDRCASNPEHSSTEKNSEAYSLWIFNVSNLGIYSHRKQAHFISRKTFYKKVM